MKILSNKAYRELITGKELTELSLKSLKSKYEFIVEENEWLHLKNDLLYVELKVLLGKAKKYDIYLQKSRARKAKARAKTKESRNKLIELTKNNMGKEIKVPEIGVGHICGYSKSYNSFIVGFNNGLGWADKSDCKILKEYQSYWFVTDFSKLEENTTI